MVYGKISTSTRRIYMKEVFLKRMKDLLQDEYSAYIETLQEERFRGIRVNTLKCSIEKFKEEFPFPITDTAFSKEAFYLDVKSEHVGNHPLHSSGACYMQEPSAMSAVEILDVKHGDWVLDMCASPGGKSTQIAAKLAHTGFLISNEIEGKRAQILLSNMERIGAGANMITNAHPKEIAKTCIAWFDRVLVDAPCSGEGMFKKHSKAMEDWSEEHVQACQQRQLQILESAYHTLKPGGYLVYSTCTYAMEENEQVVAKFLEQYDDMEQVSCAANFGRKGFPYPGMDEQKVCRIFPMDKGEGHFIAKFKKHGERKVIQPKTLKNMPLPKQIKEALEDIVSIPNGYYKIQQEKVYYKQTPFLEMGKVRVLREGILCGEIIKNRLEPHQHLFMSAYLRPYIKQVCALDEEMLALFVSGNQLPIQGFKGYCGCSYHNLIIGFGKGDYMVIKNKYPKGLRMQMHINQNN